jgi:c-di-GMP-binding flagellar brake protein YcgR
MAQSFEHDHIISSPAAASKSFRYPANISALAALVNHGKEKKLPDTVLRNVSCTGAGILSAISLPIGETISLQFYLPETGLPFRALCSVIWSNSQGHCGVRFQQVSEQHRRRLQTWLISKAAEHQPS